MNKKYSEVNKHLYKCQQAINPQALKSQKNKVFDCKECDQSGFLFKCNQCPLCNQIEQTNNKKKNTYQKLLIFLAMQKDTSGTKYTGGYHSGR